MFKGCWDWLILVATIYIAVAVPYNASFVKNFERLTMPSDVIVEALFIVGENQKGGNQQQRMGCCKYLLLPLILLIVVVCCKISSRAFEEEQQQRNNGVKVLSNIFIIILQEYRNRNLLFSLSGAAPAAAVNQ